MTVLKAEVDAVYEDSLASSQVLVHVATAFADADEKSLLLVARATPRRPPGSGQSCRMRPSPRSNAS